MADITLSAGVRQNLLSLQNTSNMMSQTQNRLATGKEVNSALDNPSNFFTSQSLSSRANEMSSLMDSMANGVKTLEAADNGLSAITNTLESMQSTLRQARQDKSFQTESYDVGLTGADDTEQITFSGGAVDGDVGISLSTGEVETPAAGGTSTIDGTDFSPIEFSVDGANEDTLTFDIDVDGSGSASTISISQSDVDGELGGNTINSLDELAQVISANTDFGNLDATVAAEDGNLVFTSDSTGVDSKVEITDFKVTDVSVQDTIALGSSLTEAPEEAPGTEDVYGVRTVDQLVKAINEDPGLDGKIRASNDDGKLRIENLSTQSLDVAGFDSEGELTGGTESSSIEGNSVRGGLADQFNELKDQLDKLSDDASYNGVNLLRGDNLKITFNETGTSTIDIQTEDGGTINSANLGLTSITAADLDSDETIDGFVNNVKGAVDEISSQSSTFGSNLSIVENRQDFTKNMVNTLETGADNLVLADMNEEGANMMALQTRQQLSSTALSLASQSDQNVLQLIR